MTDTISGSNTKDQQALDDLTESMGRSVVSAPTESYQYTSLPDANCFRLLTIHPSSECTAPLVLSLKVVHFDDVIPQYEAISYVWTQEPGHEVATCDGRRLDNISTNLYEALLTLRFSIHERSVWVDALCIRQDDEVEKGTQIRKMHLIYDCAERVIVWLGRDPEDHASAAFSRIDALNIEAMSNNGISRGPSRPTRGFIKKGKEMILPRPAPLPAMTDRPAWAPVRALFLNKWFLRMWVLQEIVLAHGAILIWGKRFIYWEFVEDAVDLIHDRPQLEAYLQCRGLQNALFMRDLHVRYRDESNRLRHDREDSGGKPHPFLHLLDIGRSFDVTEPRDKVYGLLGFPTRDAARDTNVFVVPDYNKGVGTVFAEVAWKVIQSDGDLNILSFVAGNDGEGGVTEDAGGGLDGGGGETQDIELKKYPDLPSWVPDWTSKTVIYPFIGVKPENRHRAGTFRKVLSNAAQLHPGTNMLSVLGAEITTVTEVSAYVPYKPYSQSDAVLKKLVGFFLRAPKSFPFVSYRTLALTLTAGRDVEGKLVSPDEEPQHAVDIRTLVEGLGVALAHLHYFVSEPEKLRRRAGEDGMEGDPELAREAVWRFSCYRRGFRTADGRVGLGPGAARAGDVLAVLWGGQVPVLLRRIPGEEGRWRFVGEAFVEGLVRGEVEDMLERGEMVERRFDIV